MVLYWLYRCSLKAKLLMELKKPAPLVWAKLLTNGLSSENWVFSIFVHLGTHLEKIAMNHDTRVSHGFYIFTYFCLVWNSMLSKLSAPFCGSNSPSNLTRDPFFRTGSLISFQNHSVASWTLSLFSNLSFGSWYKSALYPSVWFNATFIEQFSAEMSAVPQIWWNAILALLKVFH